MKIWIETDALAGPENELLWGGALYGLQRLQQLGHVLAFDESPLSDAQKALLENDQVVSTFKSATEADLQVTSADGALLLKHDQDTQNTYKDWIRLSEAICFPQRRANISRNTSETKIVIDINLDGTGKSDICTGLGFLDHMLEQIARHGLIDLTLSCDGDLEVDEHHTIEDVAIALGKAIAEALGDKTGIQRYSFVLPMDESQATVALDLSGRPYLVFEGAFEREKVGDFPTEMTEHFFYSLVMNLNATLHVSVTGKNDHHKIESCFKGFARCLRAAVSRSERSLNILPSTKDLL